jgi:hypothetical protein
VRTDGLSTDEGLRVRILDVEDPRRLELKTEALTGTHDWTKVGTTFKIRAATHLLEIRLARDPSWKFDNKIHGAAWIDSLLLKRNIGKTD